MVPDGAWVWDVLLTALAPNALDESERSVSVARLAAVLGLENLGSEIPEPLLHPQQQAYQLMALAGWSDESLGDLGELLGSAARQSPHSRGVVPVGALGTPLRAYWKIAADLLGAQANAQAAAPIVATLAGMARQYSEDIESAMANSELWFNAASPVDVTEIDIICIAVIAARRLGAQVIVNQLANATENLDGTARVPIAMASEMITSLLLQRG